jgi:hypothetical protein
MDFLIKKFKENLVKQPLQNNPSKYNHSKYSLTWHLVPIGALGYIIPALVFHFDLVLKFFDLVVAQFAVVVKYHIAVLDF